MLDCSDTQRAADVLQVCVETLLHARTFFVTVTGRCTDSTVFSLCRLRRVPALIRLRRETCEDTVSPRPVSKAEPKLTRGLRMYERYQSSLHPDLEEILPTFQEKENRQKKM